MLERRDAHFVEQMVGLARDEQRRTQLPALLRAQKWGEFVLPLSTRHRVMDLDQGGTKCLGSSAGPILFRFFSATHLPDYIVKSGDDIRQDELVMTIGALFNRIWAAEEIPVSLITYQCRSVGTKGEAEKWGWGSV